MGNGSPRKLNKVLYKAVIYKTTDEYSSRSELTKFAIVHNLCSTVPYIFLGKHGSPYSTMTSVARFFR